MGQAVDEICNRVNKIVDQAFLREYVADCNSIASRLAAYPDSHDVTILQTIFNEGSNLIYRLRGFDTFEGITAVNYISTLHLIAVKALSEHSPEFSGYRETLNRLGKEYADWCESHSERLNDFVRASVSDISRNPFLKGSSTEPYEIDIKSSDSDIPTLYFGYVFYDLWHNGEDQSIHHYSLKFELIDRKWYDWESYKTVSSNVTLNEVGKKNPSFLKASKKAYNEASDLRNAFLNDRLSITNDMKESILSNCRVWKSL
ncbi:hypothetical protein CN444_29875 [Bacillus thuringiensis]|uniref:hypothetical protein n=1 Tax=Bacillus thuringiensis TaxID=1428 RepID=UPI000BF944C7|nr:hypothetical protein [Bacillus thuringiensis]PEW37194.1 hypothetical protein CN444_29875 [Bacillus thuringiensis]